MSEIQRFGSYRFMEDARTGLFIPTDEARFELDGNTKLYLPKNLDKSNYLKQDSVKLSFDRGGTANFQYQKSLDKKELSDQLGSTGKSYKLTSKEASRIREVMTHCCSYLRGLNETSTTTFKEESIDDVLSDPTLIKNQISQYVIGQDRAVEAIAIALSETYMRSKCDIEYQSTNILLIGPTGVGKTLTVETAGKLYDMPYKILKAGQLVQNGIKGNSPDDFFKSLKEEVDRIDASNVDEPKKPIIVFIDEIDKICGAKYGGNYYGEALQDHFICYMDAASVAGLDTRRILFIGGGAFEGLESTVQLPKMGFKIEPAKPTNYDLETQLQMRGMKRELLGRFPVRVTLDPLSGDNLYRILTESKSSVLTRQIEFYRRAHNFNLSFSDEALRYIANQASKRSTGARALAGIIESILSPYKFEIKQYRGREVVIGMQEVIDSMKAA